jgi:uncharacterized protein YjiS (DUF1127 family)
MILLSATTLRLPRPDGSAEILNLDTLRDELWHCCRACGHFDAELTDDLIAVVERFVRARCHEGACLNLRDVDDLVVRALTDIGLRDVAAGFCELRKLPAASPGPVLAPDGDALKKLLATELFFLNRPLDRVVEAVLKHLTLLGLRRCTSIFLVELAKTICLNEENAPDDPRHETDYWLLHRTQMPALLAPPQVELIGSDIITFRSVSVLFPNIAADVNLGRFIHRQGDILTELEFYPAFNDLCDTLHGAVATLQGAVKQRCTNLQPKEITVSVDFHQLAVQAVENLCLSPAGVRRMRRELEQIAGHHLHDAQVSFD